MMSVLFGYEISVAAGFVRLCDLNYGKYVPLRDLNDNRFSVTVGFGPLFFFYEISKTIGFASLRDFNDGWFRSVTRLQ